MRQLIIVTLALASLILPSFTEATEKPDRYYNGVGILVRKEIFRGKESIIVDNVLPDGPAEKAGIRVGDIILEVDGRSVSDLKASQVTSLLQDGDDTSQVYIKIWRVILQDSPSEAEIMVERSRIDRVDFVPLGSPFTGSVSFYGGRLEFFFKVEEIKKNGNFRYTYRFKNSSKQEIYFQCEVLDSALGNVVMNGASMVIYPIFFKPGESKTFVLETKDFPDFFGGVSRILARPHKDFLGEWRKNGWTLPKDGFWKTVAADRFFVGGFVPASRLKQYYEYHDR